MMAYPQNLRSLRSVVLRIACKASPILRLHIELGCRYSIGKKEEERETSRLGLSGFIYIVPRCGLLLLYMFSLKSLIHTLGWMMEPDGDFAVGGRYMHLSVLYSAGADL